jgi:hypothetical protein
MGTDMYSLPQLLPKSYTDDSIIPAIVIDVIPVDEQKKSERKDSFISRLKGQGKGDRDGKLTKVVYMPRREYLKFFARDVNGVYRGSEPYRMWTETELEETFGKYKPADVKPGGSA